MITYKRVLVQEVNDLLRNCKEKNIELYGEPICISNISTHTTNELHLFKYALISVIKQYNILNK
jgi:hypothetical protein